MWMCVCCIEEIQIGEVQMPPKMQKKGRPKGSGLTVIGLPKKVNRASTKPTTFLKKSQWEKSKRKWTKSSGRGWSPFNIVKPLPLESEKL